MPEQPESQALPDPQPKPSNRGAWISGAIVLCVAVAVTYFVIDSSIKGARSKAAEEAAKRDDLASLTASIVEQRAELAKTQAEIDALKLAHNPEVAVPEAQQYLKNGEYQLVLVRLGKLMTKDRKRPDVQALIDRATRETRKNRIDYAREYEEEHLKDGEDYTVKATGTDNTTLSITYIGISRPMVYKMQNDSDQLQKWEDLGFKSFYLSNGYHYWGPLTWEFHLQSEEK
jgi:Zn-dependent metalloprotease